MRRKLAICGVLIVAALAALVWFGSTPRLRKGMTFAEAKEAAGFEGSEADPAGPHHTFILWTDTPADWQGRSTVYHLTFKRDAKPQWILEEWTEEPGKRQRPAWLADMLKGIGW